MTPRNRALDRIVQADQRLKQIAGRWNAVDLSAIGNCVSALEASSTDLCAAAEILKSSPARPGSPLRANVLDLKQSVARLERLVDASAAFLRSAPGLACDQPVLYQAGGVVRQPASFSETPGMQG